MDLADTAWTLVGFETDARVIPAAPNAPATLDFATGGEPAAKLSGSGGCNRYFASYSLAGDRLTVGQIGSSRMMCDPERMEQEDRFFQALQAAERCELRGDELRITYAGGTLRLARRAVPAAGPSQGDVGP